MEGVHAPIGAKKVHSAHLQDTAEPSLVSDPSAKLVWKMSEANVNELAENFIRPAKTHLRLQPQAVPRTLDESRRTLSEMSVEERKSCSRQIRIQAEAKINKVLPRVSQIKLNNVEK